MKTDTFKRALSLASHYLALANDPEYQAALARYEEICRELIALPLDAPAETKERLCSSMVDAFNHKMKLATRYSRLYLEKTAATN